MIFNTFERMVAFRYLRARRQEGFISVIAIFSLLGIALGVTTLIIVMSVMNGFRAELLGRILGINGHLAVMSATSDLGDYGALAQKVKSVSGVLAVVPQVEGQVLASGAGNAASGALVRGVPAEDLAKIPSVAQHLSPGTMQSFDEDSVILGYRLAQKLGLRPGGEVKLI